MIGEIIPDNRLRPDETIAAMVLSRRFPVFGERGHKRVDLQDIS